MKTYTFVINNHYVMHVDLENEYGFKEARALIDKECNDAWDVKFIPIIMLNRNKTKEKRSWEIKKHYIPFGMTAKVMCENWREYLYE